MDEVQKGKRVTSAAPSEKRRSIILGECSEDLQFDVYAQCLTPVVSVEIHDIRHVTPRIVDAFTERAIVDLALSGRPGTSIGRFPEVAGHDSRPFGDMIFIPPRLRLQSLWKGGPQRSICVVFGENDDRLMQEWTTSQLNAMLDLNAGVLRETMIRLADELVGPNFQSALMIEALCTQIAILLRRHLDNPQSEAHSDGARLGAAQIRSIEDMLDCAGPTPSLAQMAEHCGMSPRHFGRLFRLACGLSVTEFAIKRRVEKAKALLGEAAMPIKQVAWECGFQTAGAFSSAFRRATGLQPSAYRNARRM